MDDPQTTLLNAAIERCTAIENRIADRGRPRDSIDKIIDAKLRSDCERAVAHARGIFWQIAKAAGLDPEEGGDVRLGVGGHAR